MAKAIKIDEMRVAIEDEMRAIVNEYIPVQFEGMRPMLAYHLGWEGEGAGPEAQGKRIRPVMLLLCTAAAGGDWYKAVAAAAAVELIHNFSLIHDDIQDQSTTRRGRKTVWVKWGIAQAINAGDAMFTLAFAALQRLRGFYGADLVLNASQTLQSTCVKLTGGQYLDLTFEQVREVSETAYWAMIGGKTAALLACCGRLGAMLGQADGETQKGFAEFGEKLGLAFQAQDDWLGIWGNAALTGKSVESDLVAGKKSLPVVFGLQNKQRFAERWLSGSIPVDEVADLAELLRTEGADDYARSCVAQLTKEALAALERSAQPSAGKAALIQLAESLINRLY